MYSNTCKNDADTLIVDVIIVLHGVILEVLLITFDQAGVLLSQTRAYKASHVVCERLRKQSKLSCPDAQPKS